MAVEMMVEMMVEAGQSVDRHNHCQMKLGLRLSLESHNWLVGDRLHLD